MKNQVSCLLSLLVLLGAGCANRGSGPQGGARDTVPPAVVTCLPENGAVNFQDKEIQIRFDEYLTLDRPTEQVLVSPPQQAQPVVKAVGKKLSVTLNDSLLPNTTYSIYFGSAIQDLNEKNPLQDYTFVFSTGESIDSLTISGRVWFAYDTKPAVGTTVGLHPVDAPDSVHYHRPFLRIARTDTTGRFVISNVKEGQYRIFALQDSNRTYTYERNEPFAFIDSVITAPASDLQLRLFVENRSDTLFLPRDTADSTATASLRVQLVPFHPQAILQLLTDRDRPVRALWADSNGILFDSIRGGTYRLRMIMDTNHDSLWTTGDYLLRRQPEWVYFFPKTLRIRDNWDFEETFRWQDETPHP